MAKTFDDKKIIYTMDRVGRAYGTKVVLKDISISYYYGAKLVLTVPENLHFSKSLRELIKTLLEKLLLLQVIQLDTLNRSLTLNQVKL